jgi:hypothetical protein
MTRRARILCALTAALIAAGSLPDQADARSRRGKGKAPASRETRSGSMHRETTRTGPGGETRTRQQDTTWTRGDGQATRDTTWTGPNGKTATRHTEVQRTGTGHTRHSTYTGPDGKTATRDASVVRDPEAGTRTRDVTWTGPEGGIATRRTETQKTEDGFQRSTTATRPDGSTTTRSTPD